MNQRILALVALLFLFQLFLTSCAASYTNPPRTLQGKDLEGVWEVHYGKKITDKLIIHEEGKFKQIFQDERTGYIFETPWNSWWLESFSDGRIYIHLEGGRYYFAGIRVAESDGIGFPCPNQIPPDCNEFPNAFWDPYIGKAVEMPGELLLTVRVDSSGKLIFHQMLQTPDGGFAIIGGDRAVFRKINADGS